jgi:hypothetical protein
MVGDCDTFGAVRARASGGDCLDRAVARVDGQNRVRDPRCSPVPAPCRQNDENSRAKFQNVRGDSSAVPFGARGVRLQSGDDIVLGEARVLVKF